MIVNFRIYKINRDTHKITRILSLTKRKKSHSFSTPVRECMVIEIVKPTVVLVLVIVSFVIYNCNLNL
jgi:hypothetical protein